jgi:hypothetical protein
MRGETSGKRLFFAVLSLSQPGNRLVVSGVDDEMESTESFHRSYLPAAEAIRLHDAMTEFLQQDMGAAASLADSVQAMQAALDDPVQRA